RLAGVYQPCNATMAIEAARILRRKGFDISDSAIKGGLESTTWPARFEVVAHRPTTIVDGGHNEQGARVLAKSLEEYFPEGGVTFVMSVLRDKDYRAMIEYILPFARRIFGRSADNIVLFPPTTCQRHSRDAGEKICL
ncbi:MAG: glutamate ligase domain-containing protein, partial [Slackia sp.]